MTVKQNEFLKEFYNLLLKYNAEINLQEDNWFEIDLKGIKNKYTFFVVALKKCLF
nr:MAG TPA: hypothetical protein [Bacteriophage sp.]